MSTPVWRALWKGRIARDAIGSAPVDFNEHINLHAIEEAAKRIEPHVLRTEAPSLLCNDLEIVAKLESSQPTGSFKVRGAANRILSLDEAERAAGVVTASSGNHGAAVAYVARRVGVPAVVSVPRWVDGKKLASLRANGAEIHADAETYDEAVDLAGELAAGRGLTFVHAFDDPEVIVGQGTAALELIADTSGLDALLVPLAGGGLAAGIAVAVKAASPATKLIGVASASAPILYGSLLAGEIIDLPEQPTFASALLGGFGERNDNSLRLCAALLDEAVIVGEREIAAAMIWAADHLGQRVEGAGAIALAPLLRPDAAAALGLVATGPMLRAAAIVSGSNIDDQTFDRARVAAQTSG